MREVVGGDLGECDGLVAVDGGCRVKTTGDGVMAVFRSAGAALDFACAIQARPGPEALRVRAGIHVGEIDVEVADIAGIEVNVASRVIEEITDAAIWVTDSAKADIDGLGARHHQELRWERHPEVAFRGLEDRVFTLCSLTQSLAIRANEQDAAPPPDPDRRT